MDFITANALIEWKKEGRAIHIYPRIHIVSVDGFKRYKINPCTISKYNYFLKNGVNLCKNNN